MKSKPNVVLVHGAWADGSSSWGRVISLLQNKGFNVTAVQLALNSLEDDIAVTRRALAVAKGPTLLVGHSYGGAVISGAAKDAANVKALVYIAAFGLDEGESLDAISKQGLPPYGATQIRPDDYGYLWIDRNGFAQAFVGDADPTEAAVMASAQKPLSVSAFTAKSGPPAWKQIPSWFLISLNDQMIPAPAQEMMAQRMNATVSRIPASHASMVAHSQEVAEVIKQAAISLGSERPSSRTDVQESERILHPA